MNYIMTSSILGPVPDLSDVTKNGCPFEDQCITKIPAYEYLDLAISKGLAELARKVYHNKPPFGQTKRQVLLRHAEEIRMARDAGVSYEKIWKMLKGLGLTINQSYMVKIIRYEIMEEGQKEGGAK